MNLQELKQNNMQKESGMVDNPEELKPLSKDDLRKIMPNKSEEKDSPKQLINDELSGIDALMESEMKEANVKMEEEIEKNKETLDDAIFDAPVEDIDAGLLTPEESEKALSDAFKNATNAVKEDPNIKAGIDAVNNVGKSTDTLV